MNRWQVEAARRRLLLVKLAADLRRIPGLTEDDVTTITDIVRDAWEARSSQFV